MNAILLSAWSWLVGSKAGRLAILIGGAAFTAWLAIKRAEKRGRKEAVADYAEDRRKRAKKGQAALARSRRESAEMTPEEQLKSIRENDARWEK